MKMRVYIKYIERYNMDFEYVCNNTDTVRNTLHFKQFLVRYYCGELVDQIKNTFSQ